MTYYGIALIVLGIFALAGIIYVHLDRKHLKAKQNWLLATVPPSGGFIRLWRVECTNNSGAWILVHQKKAKTASSVKSVPRNDLPKMALGRNG